MICATKANHERAERIVETDSGPETLNFATYGQSPRVVSMRIVPVAGQDSMLLNLSGAHGPYFTRNLAILTDEAGNTGVGEVPGGEKIRQVLEDPRFRW